MNQIGKRKNGEISVFDEKTFPEISEFALDEKELAIVEALVTSAPGDSYESIAKRAGVTVRTLYNYRQRDRVREAVLKISRMLFSSSVPKWYKALDKRASGGDVSALKLAFELMGVYVARSEHKVEGEGLNSGSVIEVAEDNLQTLRAMPGKNKTKST